MPPEIPSIPPEILAMWPEITWIAIVAIVVIFVCGTVLGVSLIRQLFGLRKRSDPKEIEALQKENNTLKGRVENLESLVCRLDQELNSQMEKSLWMMRSANLDSNSIKMTAVVDVTSALENRYQILQEIGRGGMGIVFQAYDKQLRENVAIKVLSPFLGHDNESLERLRREVTAARKITHPNVIKIFDIAEAAGLHYITMEYFPGQNLRQHISRKGPLSLQEGLQILFQICDGLEAAHTQGIIHRDLKSQNIIIGENGQVKIIDLGLARASHLDGMTATGLIMGTPEYMSPEQVMGRRVDERSDLYSLGIIFHEVFTARVPFTGETPIAVGYKHLKEEAPSLNSLQTSLPKKLSAMVDRLLQKDPANRYQSIRELRRELEELHAYRPIMVSGSEIPISDATKLPN